MCWGGCLCSLSLFPPLQNGGGKSHPRYGVIVRTVERRPAQLGDRCLVDAPQCGLSCGWVWQVLRERWLWEPRTCHEKEGRVAWKPLALSGKVRQGSEAPVGRSTQGKFSPMRLEVPVPPRHIQGSLHLIVHRK